jgi:hypothetical protein
MDTGLASAASVYRKEKGVLLSEIVSSEGIQDYKNKWREHMFRMGHGGVGVLEPERGIRTLP